MQASELQRTPLAICVDQLQQAAGPAVARENAVALSAKLLTENSTLQSCARIIRRDYGLALRVLRIANSAMFNHIGSTVMSVTHAAALMGTDALSQIVDGVPRHALPHPARELVCLSHLTASLARSLINRIEPRYAEEAYITGMFRNIGEICFALELADDYHRILAASQGQIAGLRAACRTRTKFDFDELSAGLLHVWAMHGAPILAAQSTPDALLAQQGNYEADVALAASVAHGVITSVFRCDTQERDKAMRPCTAALARRFHLTEMQVHELCFSALNNNFAIMQQMGLSKDKLRLRDWMPTQEPAEVIATPKIDIPLGATIGSVLEAAIGKGMDRAAWLTYEDPSAVVRNVAGTGWPDKAVEKLPSLLHPHKPPYLLAFAQRQDVWIDFAKDDRFRDSPLATILRPHVFYLLPVLDRRKVRGCLYFDWASRRDIAPETLLPILRTLRDYVAMNMPAA